MAMVTTRLFGSAHIAHGSTVHIAALHSQRSAGYPQLVTIIGGTEHSDISHSIENRSNYEVMLSRVRCDVVAVEGQHGYRSLAFLGDAPSALVADIVQQITTYSVIDETYLDELRHQLSDEAWESYGWQEFRREIAVLLRQHDSEHAHLWDDAEMCDVTHLWNVEVRNTQEEPFVIDPGCRFSFQVERVAAAFALSPRFHLWMESQRCIADE